MCLNRSTTILRFRSPGRAIQGSWGLRWGATVPQKRSPWPLWPPRGTPRIRKMDMVCQEAQHRSAWLPMKEDTVALRGWWYFWYFLIISCHIRSAFILYYIYSTYSTYSIYSIYILYIHILHILHILYILYIYSIYSIYILYILYYSILFYIFYIILYYSIYSILFYIILYYSILFYIILYYSIFFYIILYDSIFFYLYQGIRVYHSRCISQSYPIPSDIIW